MSAPVPGSDLVIASGNAGKIAELSTLLAGIGVALRPQADFNVPECPETGLTFVENAILKARNAARHSGLPALADDSGIEVDALAGAPGIYSARYAGPGADDAANVVKLLGALRDVPDAERGARFRCVIVYLRHADDPSPLIAEGDWNGRVAAAPAGGGGFGYDPVMYLPELGRTVAELDKADKNRLSHRAIALRQLLERLPERL